MWSAERIDAFPIACQPEIFYNSPVMNAPFLAPISVGGRRLNVPVFGATVLLSGALCYVVLAPLPWRHFPNILKMFLGSWIYLIIAGALISAGVQSAAASNKPPVTFIVCTVLGALWLFRIIPSFVTFNVGRMLLIYGLSGLAAYCLRASVRRG